ncbi:polycystin-1-like protein 2 [Branchiostoma floridae x Branchiostoma japonicum]
MSPMTTLPTLPPRTTEPTPPPPVFTTTQESSTPAPFLIEEEIPVLIKTLNEKVSRFSGSLDDRKELLKEVTDSTSSVLRAQSSSRKAVAMETTVDLSSGVTDELKDLIDVRSSDQSPVEQLILMKSAKERLKSRVMSETREMLQLMDAAADKLLEETPPEVEGTHIRSDGVLTAVKKSIPDVGTVPISQDVGSIVFTKEDNLPEDSTMKVVAFVEDPFVWSVEKAEVTSSVVMVTITKERDLTDASNLQPYITIVVKQRVQFGTTGDTEEQYHDTLPTSYRQNLDDAGRSFPVTKVPSRNTNMKHHAMYIANAGQVPLLRFSVDDVDTELQVYFRFHDFPTEEEYDYTTVVKPPEVTDYNGFDMPFGLVYSNFNVSVVPEFRMERGWLMVGVKTKGDQPHGGVTSAVPQTPPPPGRDVIPAGVTLQTAAVSCLMRENENQTWDNRRCQVGTETNETTTMCTCDMTRQSDGKSSSVILAASFFALPNFVNFDKFGSNTDKLSTNSTVYGTIVALWMIFLMSQLLILQSNIRSHIASRTAVADSIALGQAAKLAKVKPSIASVPRVSTIPSDVPGADYVYVVSVRTGTQPDAGTASVVGLMITGSEGRTAMVTLNPAGLILARGGDTYHIMTTPASVGELQSVQVWHDSSGKGAMESLFIDSIKVWDMQTSQGFCFPCYTWLSSSKGDGRTIRTLKAAHGEMQMSEYTLPTFSYLLYDYHLLLSAVCNSGVRHFSRAQRLVCCLTQTTLWMVGSAMWYGVRLGAHDVILFDAGVITLRLSELIGTAATSFTVFLPVYAILVPMFRKQPPLEDHIPPGPIKTPTSPSIRRFPYKTVAWILAILTSVCSSFFVIVYSLQFGAGRSQAWLKDFVLAFLFTTFVLEPVQIFLIAYTKAVIIGPIVWSVTACVRRLLGTNLSGTGRPPIGVIQKRSRDYEVPARRVLPPAPKKTDHDPNWVEKMTKGRSILVLLMFLLVFTGNAFYIGILGFDRHAYHVRTSLENTLLSGYEEVATADDAWKWLSSELMPSLHPERGYSGQKLRWLDKQFPVGTNAFRIGSVRLERTTEYPDDPIDIDLETSDQRLHPELMMNLIKRALRRQSEQSCPYNGTASIVDEVRNGTSACLTTVDLPRDADQAAAVIDFLKQTDWILMVSDTLILRANFYHPDVKLFSSVVFRLQYLPGGAAELQPSIQTFRLFQYQTADDYVQMIFHILFVLFYIYSVLNEIWNIRKSGRAYFANFWNILILSNIGLSTAVIVTFALRYIQAAAALRDIQQAKGLFGINEFVDISTAGQWDATFKEVMSFSIFISTFSILRVLNFSRGVATVYALPRLIYGEAFGFAVYMLVIIVAYGFSGILIFGKNMETFSAFKKTSYVLFEMGLGRPFVGVFADDMKAVDRVMGPLYYSTFVMVFVFYLLNLAVGMLCNWLSYCKTAEDIGVDTAMGDYFWNSLRSLLGMRHEPQDSDDEAPLPDHFVDETLQRTDMVLQEVDRVTDLMYTFECKKRQLIQVQVQRLDAPQAGTSST